MLRKHKRRRGVVILVVLSLLVLFTLLMATYVIVSGQFRRAAESFAREELLGVQPQKDLDRAMYQLLRDTNQRTSAVRFHSLLRDYYGEDGFRGRFRSAADLQDWNTDPGNAGAGGYAFALSGQQFRDLPVDNTSLRDLFGDSFVLETTVHPSGFCVGRVLTITSGQARGWSTKIVGFLYSPGGVPVIRVLDFRPDRGVAPSWADLGNEEFIVNGRPFSGAGVGFRIQDVDPDPTNSIYVAKSDAPIFLPGTPDPVPVPAALLPHHIVRDESGFALAPLNSPFSLFQGGSNEPYDAVDYQNMFLGMVLPNAASSLDIIPSLHRPALINHWAYESDGSGDLRDLIRDADFRRMVIMRPVAPNFDGSNPEFAVAWGEYQQALINSPGNVDNELDAVLRRYINGPWDVDNDGDGIPDSIWVDLGMPIQTADDGRKYKPLFAILCVDLDGRLNVNAHGNLTQLPVFPNRPPDTRLAAGTTLGYPKGMGYGTPEITLGLANITGNLQQLLMARHGNQAPGAAGFYGEMANDPAFDLLARIKFFEEPQNYFSGVGGLSSYFTPPDLRGELAYGLDVYGRPVWEPIPPAVVESRADSPYELNLLQQNAHDRPFTAAELEAVLRRYDIDAAQLPRRLRDLLNLTDLENTRLVTTHSFDPPVPGTTLISDLAEHQSPPGPNTNLRSVRELISARLRQNGVADAQVPAMLRHLVPSEVLMGQRLDINRPLGDGRDTSGISLVDEININEQFPINPDTGDRWNERMSGWHQGVGPSHPEFRNVPIHHTNGLDVNRDGNLNAMDLMLARQLLARHIYVLLMALRDQTHLLPDDDGTPSEEATAYALAQFAINVVDFRDADSIMTPFEFDMRPFEPSVAAQPTTTWNVDGNLSTTDPALEPNRGVVWGCERPELIITETLAWHDRRTEDTDDEVDGPFDSGRFTTETDPDERDPHFDQRLMPRGSFFVELFNPWTAVTESAIANPRAADVKPAELYDAAGVQLNKVVTSGGVTSPVWRMMFVKDATPGLPKDPDHPDPNRRPNAAEDEIRLIYFVNPTIVGATTPETTGLAGVYTSTLPVGSIAPGQYAVIGSPGINVGQDFISPVGRSASMTGEANLGELAMAQTRRVVLSPEGPAPQVRVLANGDDLPGVMPADPNNAANPGTYVNYPNPDGTSPDAPYVVAQPDPAHLMPPRAIVINLPPLSVSEPPEDYDRTNFVNPTDSGTVEGFNSPPLDIPFDMDRYGNQLMTDGTYVWGTIHLQRLANPNLLYDPVTNPYRTIDSLRVDLTSFNGVNPLGAETIDGDPVPRQHIRLFSVQRGDSHSRPGTSEMLRRQFWPQEPTVALDQTENWGAVDPNSPDASHYFNFYMRTTLGSLNHGFWPYNDATLGDIYRGSPSVDVTDAATVNNQAFSSLAWNNRPFVSGYELMQVPLRRSSQLLSNYWLLPGGSPYDMADPVAQYGHLVNFFHSSPANVQNASVHAYRLLEYVHVPSRFVGTDTLLSPEFFRNLNPVTNPLALNNQNLNPSFLTPFNRVSRYRDPGRVNINTIYHEKVWEALFGGGYAQVPFQNVVASRRGSAGNRPELLPRAANGLPDPRFPSFFANPFRPPGHGSLVPLPDLERPDVETTLLRSRATVPDYGGPAQTPPGNLPLMEGGHVSMNEETIASTHPRNSSFRYNALRRMGNMVTTRSNVYAIWITVGYFDVEPNIPPGQQYPVVDVFHPDGFRVAQEVGIDTGQVRRHRAFYIVDRTIPVAFQPGQNHNVDRAVLLRRFIE